MKRLVSIVLGAAMLLSSFAANAAITEKQMNTKTTVYRTYDNNGALAPIANGKNAIAIAKAGDWIYIAEDETTYGLTAYNTKTREYTTLEEKAAVKKDGVTAVNTDGENSFYPSSVTINGDYMYVGYVSTGNYGSSQYTKAGGFRMYDISDPDAPTDVTMCYGTNQYTGIPCAIDGTGIVSIEAFGGDKMIFGSYSRNGIAVMTAEGVFEQLFTDTTKHSNGDFKVVNCVYDDTAKQLYITTNGKGSWSNMKIYNLNDTENITFVNCIPRQPQGTKLDGTEINGEQKYYGTLTDNGSLAKWKDGFVIITGNNISYVDIVIDGASVRINEKNRAMLDNKNTAVKCRAINGNYLYLGTGNYKNIYVECHDFSDLQNNKTERVFYNALTIDITANDGSINKNIGGTYPYCMTKSDSGVIYYQSLTGPAVLDVNGTLAVPETDGITYSTEQITGGDINVTTKVTNVSFKNRAPYIVTALYNDTTLEMEAIEYDKVTINAGESASHNQTINVPSEGNYHIETFVFHDLESILPVETGTQGILK